MSDARSTLSPRLRGVGIGSIIGGLALVLLSVLVAYPLSATAVFALGVVNWLLERRGGGRTGVGAGVTAVGGIAVLEATGLVGLGFGPVVLGALAVGAGLIDVVLGFVVSRSTPRPDDE